MYLQGNSFNQNERINTQQRDDYEAIINNQEVNFLSNYKDNGNGNKVR